MDDIAIHTEAVTKRYGSFTAVDRLTISVVRGEIFGFLGPNGAGKTTSINIICGLMRPTEGDVFIDGRSVGHDTRAVKGIVGCCPQELILWEKLTCREQLLFLASMYDVPHKERTKRADDLLTGLGLFEKRNKAAKTLSGGMKRRLNIALSLIHNPSIVVLDEPEAGLDPQSRTLVRDYIRALSREHGKTVILTTHNMDEAERLADRVAIIDRGTLIALDTPDALKSREGAGDVLEITFAENAAAVRAGDALTGMFTVTVRDASLLVRDHDMVSSMGAIAERLKKASVTADEMKLRANTLEDVFIAMTGRRLRE
ncbi:MAG: ABC transporter ATP-binding protein [Spirochaetes bacterium]|nr:ABC transporter ATP-binding protein [Spirochaetota bacterium]